MSDAAREWNGRARLMWWVKLIGLSIPLAGAIAAGAIGGGKWIYTRASAEEVDAAATAALTATQAAADRLEAKKEDKSRVADEIRRVEGKVDNSAAVIGNVRDNLLIIMGEQGLRPKPLPRPVEP